MAGKSYSAGQALSTTLSSSPVTSFQKKSLVCFIPKKHPFDLQWTPVGNLLFCFWFSSKPSSILDKANAPSLPLFSPAWGSF